MKTNQKIISIKIFNYRIQIKPVNKSNKGDLYVSLTHISISDFSHKFLSFFRSFDNQLLGNKQEKMVKNKIKKTIKKIYCK